MQNNENKDLNTETLPRTKSSLETLEMFGL